MARRITVNDEFFSKLNNINCYWAGFLAADGCIRRNNKTIWLVLDILDVDHLNLFADTISFNGKIYIRNGHRCELQFRSPSMVSDLYSNFSITPAKTFTLKPPTVNSKNHILSYTAGYIDGDGSIQNHKSVVKSGVYCYPYIEIVGTRELMTWMRDSLMSLGVVDDRSHVTIRGSIFDYHIRGSKAVNFYNNIKYLNIPLLKRKWDKMEV